MATSIGVERSLADEPVSRTIVAAVAAHTGTDPLELEPLYDTVDPDALDSLFGTGEDQSSTRVAFTYCGCDVVVSTDDGVRVERADRTAPNVGDV